VTSAPGVAAAGHDLAGQPPTRNGSAPRAHRPEPIRASELEPKPVSWLWPGRIPLGLLTYLAGEPGLGKSLLAVRLAAMLSRGELIGAEANSLILSAEDSREHVLLPRLRAAGAELTRVFFPPLGEDGFEQLIRLPDDLDRLGELVSQVGAKLVVVDPLVAHLPERVNSWQDQSVRTALAPLHRLAEETGAAFLLIGHLNKGEGNKPLERIGGSIGIPAAARSVLLLARDPDDPEGEAGLQRVLAHVKSNVGLLSTSLAFGLEPVTLDGDDQIESVRVVQLGGSRFVGSELLGEQRKRPSKLERATSLLESELAEGPKPVAELQAKASELSISSTTLERAKAELAITSDKLGLNEGWNWTLPEAGESVRLAGE
jgi:AAA domain